MMGMPTEHSLNNVRQASEQTHGLWDLAGQVTAVVSFGTHLTRRNVKNKKKFGEILGCVGDAGGVNILECGLCHLWGGENFGVSFISPPILLRCLLGTADILGLCTLQDAVWTGT